MDELYNRTRLLVGDEAMTAISSSHVILFGVGGVGGWCAESLIRSGVSRLVLVDADVVCATNLNRQLPATLSALGRSKVEVLRERLLDINPDAEIVAVTCRYDSKTASTFNLADYDYVIDAIDSLSDKALLILNATRSGVKLFSSMGAALKMDASRIAVAEFWSVKGCPLAAALRRRFKKSKEFPARKFRCVYSDEIYENRGEVTEAIDDGSMTFNKVRVNGTIAHTTAIFGFSLASLVINDIINNVKK